MHRINLIGEFNRLEKLLSNAKKKAEKQTLLKKLFEDLHKKEGILVINPPPIDPFAFWEIILSPDGRSLEKCFGPYPRPFYLFNKNAERIKTILLKVRGDLSQKIEEQQQKLKAINEILKKSQKLPKDA